MRLTVHVFVVIDHNHCARVLFLSDTVFARMDFVRLFRRRFARFRRVVCFLVGDAERRVVVDAGDVPDSQRRIVGAREQPSIDDLHGGKQNINLNNPTILCSCVAVLGNAGYLEDFLPHIQMGIHEEEEEISFNTM